MLYHYLKIAFRNLRKYKTQNIISIIGLAVGFVCFAFSALWIRYEMSYDNFHPKADRIYRVQMARFKWDTFGANASEIQNPPFPLANWLKSNFPEIEDACVIEPGRKNENYSVLYIDSSFCNMFNVNVPKDFFIEGRTDRPAVLTNDLKEVVENIKEELNYDIQTTIPDWPANTNIPFNILVPISPPISFTQRDAQSSIIKLNSPQWYTSSSRYHTYILIKKGIDIQAMIEKLDKIMLPEFYNPVSLVITPLKQLRYKDPSGNIQSDIKFSHIQIFAIAGLLVILCSLFNHLMLYVTHVRMRLRELTLRKVNGATDMQIASTLYVDFLLVILLSLVAGFMLTTWLLPTFKEYANIGSNDAGIYTELLLYSFLLIICGLLTGGIPILYFRKRDMNESIKGYGNLFRKVCLLLQLIISLGLMFCSVVFIKQLYFLQHTDLGINRHNIASVYALRYPLLPHYADRIKQISGIKDVLPITDNDFLKNLSNTHSMTIRENDGGHETFTLYGIVADAHFFDFFGVEIIEGVRFSNEYDRKRVLNETAVKEMGEALSEDHNTTIGVARDFFVTPTTKTKPLEIYFPDPQSNRFRAIAYKYEEGMRQQTQQAITEWLRKEFPNQGEFKFEFVYMEDVFNEYFKSERALLTLLSVMTIACILLAVFGVYSMTNLTCQQRRKEIAIRKINGAEVLDVMNIFFKEYLLMLSIAALVAFPAGYVIMKRWMENYVKQTSIDAWLFVLIFLIVFLVIVFSIISMVWKAANQNPAEVVKSE
jgi:ABC-type antimicrobial peptide transport system permease subunit